MAVMETSVHWTSVDLDSLPDDGKRYEIIDGDLLVSKQPHYYHQRVCTTLSGVLDAWSSETGAGETSAAPGLIFADDQDVVPDVIWISRERLSAVLGPDGKLHGAPDLVVEVISPGLKNERRDRETKLKLYSERGVMEYWITDWRSRRVEIYRRDQAHHLKLDCTLGDQDILTSPLLTGFSCPVSRLFKGIPAGQ
jgi:Uma2 family endonuclease